MQKTNLILTLGLSLFSLQTFATTSITMALTGTETLKNYKEKQISLNKLNKDLTQKGIKSFSSTITLGPNDGAKYNQLVQDLAIASKAINRNITIISKGFYNKLPSICYTGEGAEVLATLNALRGSVFFEELGISLVRWGKNKQILYTGGQTIEDNADFRAYHEVYNKKELNIWDNYNTNSDAVVLLSDMGEYGSGAELFATTVPRCK